MKTEVTSVNLLLKGVDSGKIRAAKIEAVRAGISLKEWVLVAIEEKLGTGGGDGDDKRRAEGGVGQDHGEVGTVDEGGTRDLRAVDKEARGIQGSERKAGVRLLRGEIRRPAGKAGTGAILRSSGEAQSESGGVDGGIQPDTKKQGVCERPFVDVPHMADCDCSECEAKRWP